MTLGTHVVVGALAGSIVSSNPVLAGVLGFASHFLLDAVPHWDYHLDSSRNDPKNRMKNTLVMGRSFFFDLLKIGCDILIGAAIVFLMLANAPGPALFAAIIGAFFAALPDFLQFVYFRYPHGIIKSLQKFHVVVVHAKSDYNDRPLIGIFFQVSLIAMVFFLSIGILFPKEVKVAPPVAVIPAADARIKAAEAKIKDGNTALISALNDSYLMALSAIRDNADNFFVNPNTSSPSLVFSSATTSGMSLESGRVEVRDRLGSMRNKLAALGSTTDATSILKEFKRDLGEIKLFMDNLSLSLDAVSSIPNLPKSTVALWKAELFESRNNLNRAVTAVLIAENNLELAKLNL